jgi:sulfatase modifying factor 1
LITAVTLDDIVQLPGGTFLMGLNDHYSDERPAHSVTVDGFEIDRCAVTNVAFFTFIAATGYVTFAERPLDPTL